MKLRKYLVCSLIALFAATAFANEQPGNQAIKVTNATKLQHPEKSAMFSSALAGKRVVAVGEQGVVILSDDSGKTFRQASTVPIAFTLTSVTFIDALHGWAAGHGGSILNTVDGGETWKLQRIDTHIDQPLFSIYFKDQKVGYAVGLWSLVLKTVDGGLTWNTLSLPPAPGQTRADRNLNTIFGIGNSIYIASEQGAVIKSIDEGMSWTYSDTGYSGSWWTGVSTKENSILIGGMRGNLYRSVNAGNSWLKVSTGSKKSVTGFLINDASIFAYGLDGLLICSANDGDTFEPVPSSINGVLTTATQADSQLLLFSKNGFAGSVSSTCKSGK